MSELILLGWLSADPNTILNEVASSMVRMDVEPRFFTFLSLSNMGKRSETKFTDPYFELNDLNTKYDFKGAKNLELRISKQFDYTMKLLLDGITDKMEMKKAL